MVKNREPNRGEANDIYNTLKSGASGLVLAAETAIGKYPMECVTFLKKIIEVFKKYKN
jgi:pyruvate kinase